jgi:hypothetical protein
VRANPGAFSRLLAAAWGLTGGSSSPASARLGGPCIARQRARRLMGVDLGVLARLGGGMVLPSDATAWAQNRLTTHDSSVLAVAWGLTQGRLGRGFAFLD